MDDSPQPALVLDRWNSWVRVYLPESGETRWIDLAAVEAWQPCEEPAGPAERAAEARGR